MANLQIPSAWNRIVMGTGRIAPSLARTGDIVLPPIRRAPHLPIELSGLLPNRDHNSDLLQAIDLMPHCLPGERPVFGILAADPFLRVDQLAERLAGKGYRDLANLPSAAQYGASFRTILNSLNVGPERERHVLRQFAGFGFSISVAVAHGDDVEPALALVPARLFAVPSFDLWHDGVFDREALLAFCRLVARLRDGAAPATPVILFGGLLGISAERARDAGADGVLLD